MKKVIIKDIEIQYSDEQIEKVDYIIDIINKNYNLILEMFGTSRIISLIPTNEENAVYIQNFDDTFYNGTKKSLRSCVAQIALPPYPRTILKISSTNSAARRLDAAPMSCHVSSMKMAFSAVRSSFALSQT